MPHVILNQLVPWLRRARNGAGQETDEALLGQYSLARDEAAFAELLRRYGPLVWRRHKR